MPSLFSWTHSNKSKVTSDTQSILPWLCCLIQVRKVQEAPGQQSQSEKYNEGASMSQGRNHQTQTKFMYIFLGFPSYKRLNSFELPHMKFWTQLQWAQNNN